MSATYGRLTSDKGHTSATKAGHQYVEATVQSETVRAIVTAWASDRVDIELRATDDRADSGRVLARLTLYPAGEVLPVGSYRSGLPVLLIEATERVEVRP